MPSIYNPTDCEVDHNINGNVYKIPPKGTVPVPEGDAEDLIRLLNFLVLQEDDGKMLAPLEPNDKKNGVEAAAVVSGDIELKEVTEETITAREKRRPRQYSCDSTVKVVDSATGIKRTVPCGFTTTQKRALLAHGINEHPKKARTVDSLAADESSTEELREDEVVRRRSAVRSQSLHNLLITI